MEKFDLYDINRQKLGKTHDRNSPIPKDCCRIVVHCCIFNSKGEMLIQKRSATKKVNPNLWDISLGGCVQAGETSQEAMTRELSEELGICHNFSGIIPHLTINFVGGFDDFYILTKDVDINSEINFTDNEVQCVKWASKAEIITMMKNKTFLPYHPELISMLFVMSKTADYGAFQYNIFSKDKQ